MPRLIPLDDVETQRYKPTFEFMEPTTPLRAWGRTGQEVAAGFAHMGNILLGGIPQVLLRRELGQELPVAPSLPGKILQRGLETLGFAAGPYQIGRMAGVAVPGAGLMAQTARGGVELGTSMGLMQPERMTEFAAPERLKAARTGVIWGAAFPLAGAALKKAIPVLANIMTGSIPQSQTKIAMENPELVLNPEVLEQERKIAGDLYSQYVDPLITKDTILSRQDFVNNLISQGFVTPNLEITPTFETKFLSQLTPAKQQRVIDWIERITGRRTVLSTTPIVGPGGRVMSPKEWAYLLQKGRVPEEEIQAVISGAETPLKGDFTFKDAMKIRNEISPYLTRMWTKEQIASVYEHTTEKTVFESIAERLRGIVAQGVNSFDPDAGAAIERWSNYEVAKGASQSFKGMHISFFRTILPRIFLASLGMPGKIAALASVPFAMPQTWGGLIRGGAAVTPYLPAAGYMTAERPGLPTQRRLIPLE